MSQLTSGEYDAVLNGVRLHYTIRGRQGGPALIVAIAVEDSAAMKAGLFLPDEKQGERAS